MMGMTAGLLKNTPLVNHKYAMVLFGFVWGFVSRVDHGFVVFGSVH